MTRLAVSVEGRTEEEFVKQVLAGHLRERRVEPTPILLGRGRSGSRGGNVSSDRLVSEMLTLLASFDVVTSLVDYYGFRDKGDRSVTDLEKHLRGKLRKGVRRDWDERRLIPYVQRHEFEGLLFSDVHAFAHQPGFPDTCVDELGAVRDQFTTPEDINDDTETAPSKRLGRAIPRYDKVLHGPTLAATIGLDTIRAECPRFDAWVGHLESLGPE